LEIRHILADGTIETNSAAERRLISLMNVRPDMFQTEGDCIEEAYNKQANNIAYSITARDQDPQYREAPDEDLHNRLHQ